MQIVSKTDETLYFKTLCRNLINIFYTRTNFNKSAKAEGKEIVSDKVIDRATEIIIDLDYQPDLVCPTGRGSMQLEWDLDDNSYLEFEIFDDKITCMNVPASNSGRDYSGASHDEMPFGAPVSWIKDKIKNFILTYEESIIQNTIHFIHHI